MKACGSDAGAGVARAHEHHLKLPAEAHASISRPQPDVQHDQTLLMCTYVCITKSEDRSLCMKV